MRLRAGAALRLSICVWLVLLVSCGQKGSSRVASGLVADQIIEDFQLCETFQGRVLYILNAERAFVYGDSNRIEVVEPAVRFYDTGGDLTSTLTARAGTVHTRTSDLVARQEVRVATRDSTTLETDSLVWRNRDQLVMTDAQVLMHSPSGSVTGVGLVSDAGLRRIEIRQAVQAQTEHEFGQ